MNRSLSFKISVGIFLLLSVLCGFTIFLMYHMMNQSIENTVSSYSIQTAENIVKNIDVDEYEKFLNDQTENDVYWRMRNNLSDLRVKTGAMYVYTMAVDGKTPKILVDGFPKGEKDAVKIGTATQTTTYEEVSPVLDGKASSTGILHDKEFGDYLSAFAPIKKDGKVIGILDVDISAKKVKAIQSEVIKKQLFQFSILFIVGIVFIISILFFYIRSKLKSLKLLSQISEEMAKGDLQLAAASVEELKVKGNDEIRTLSESSKRMIINVHDMITHISVSSNEMIGAFDGLNKNIKDVEGSNEQIVSSIQDVFKGAEHQLISMKESSTALEEMAVGIQKVAESSSSVAEFSTHMTNQVEKGNEDIQNIMKQMNTINQTVAMTAEKVGKLGQEAKEIDNIIDVITDISEQTNLLALNANIEAARAGEFGKGFAVVANEVRKLAEQSNQSAHQISQLIEHFQTITKDVVREIEIGTEEVQRGTTVIGTMKETFTDILASVHQVNGELQEISAITEELSVGSEEISAAVEQSTSIANKTTDYTKNVVQSANTQVQSMQEISALSEKLKEISQQLEQAMNQFHF
ncbi:methyl-accepting chemotaxis protein [Microbacteriaceae bacterium 4G12]